MHGACMVIHATDSVILIEPNPDTVPRGPG